MRLHRFFVSRAINSTGIDHFSSEELAHQLKRVFRLHEGDKAIFFDGSGVEHVSEIVSLENDGISFRVLETYPVKLHARRRLALAVSLIKKDNFEWIIQKGTELGVSEFVPLISDRSEKKGFNMERARKIMIEACEQSGRGDVPSIVEPRVFAEFISTERRPLVAFHTTGDAFSSQTVSDITDVVALIGPEGGWSDPEIGLLREKGASVARLDAPVLRAETAAIVAATLLLLP